MRHKGRALNLKTKDLIGYLWTSLFIDQSECLLYHREPSHPFKIWIKERACFVFWGGHVYNGNWTEWSGIWSEIIRVNSKPNERAARVRFEITSMISNQNCTPLSSITTLLNPFWNHPNTALGQFKYFLDAELRRFLNKKRNRKRFYFNTL